MSAFGKVVEIVMNKKLIFYTIIGIIFVSVTGTVLHFIYEMSGYYYIAGLFAPVNESTWEHMKLIFFPMLVFALVSYLPLKTKYPCIGAAMSAGILTGTALIPVIFYTYSGVLGFNTLYLDIATFYICVIAAFFVVYKIASKCKKTKLSSILGMIVFAMIIMFFVFSYYPPQLGLFAIP